MTDPIAPLIQSLHEQGRLRVWSLIITVFGDLVQHRGGEISTTRLGILLDRVGVERGAIRTALSRLGRDGWVTRTRKGRSSIYRLSSEGLARFEPATSRIYAPPLRSAVTNWALDLNLSAAGTVQFDLRPDDQAGGGADLRISGAIDHLSTAFRESLLPSGHRRALEALADDLFTLDKAPPLDRLDAAAARMLLIHRWRRITLRYDDIWPDLMPQNAALQDPRRRVADAYRRLTPATEAWLDHSDAGLSALPAAAPNAANRFLASDHT